MERFDSRMEGITIEESTDQTRIGDEGLEEERKTQQ